MSYCERCHAPVENSKQLLCARCVGHAGDQIIRPVIAAYMWAVIPPDMLSVIRDHMVVLLWEAQFQLIPVKSPAPPLASDVVLHERWWQLQFSMMRQIREKAITDPFYGLWLYTVTLMYAVTMRRIFRRYLWKRFRWDVRRPRSAKLVQSCQTRDSFYAFYHAHGKYQKFDIMYTYGFMAFFRSIKEKKKIDDKRIDALQAMLDVLETPVDEDSLLASPIEEQRVLGSIMGAGWAASQISLKYARLREALSEADVPLRTAMREWLPSLVYLTFRDRKTGETFTELRSRIAKSLTQDSPITRRGKRQIELSEPVETDRLHMKVPDAFESWQVTQEVHEQLNEIRQRAGLTPREAEVLDLTLDDLTQSEIAARLDVDVGTVKTLKSRAMERLRRAAHS